MNILKLIKALGTGVKEEMDTLSENDLRDSIVIAATSMREITTEMHDDDKLNAAKEMVKDLSSSYRDAKKAQQAKIQYALYRLDEIGKPMNYEGK